MEAYTFLVEANKDSESGVIGYIAWRAADFNTDGIVAPSSPRGYGDTPHEAISVLADSLAALELEED